MTTDDERLIDNAAACSQHKSLLNDESVRECIFLNVIKPLKEARDALAAALKVIALDAHENDMARWATGLLDAHVPGWRGQLHGSALE